jgi:hypothetical protein
MAGWTKSGHNEPESKHEQVHYFDEAEARMLGVVLADDAHFQAKAALVAASPILSDRRAKAHEEARDYAPYEGPHRATVARLLTLAAEVDAEAEARGWVPWIEAVRRDALAKSSARAVWAETEPEDEDARRRRDRWKRLQEGAERLARFGAAKCIECEEQLDPPYDLRGGSRPRSARRTHCLSCEQRLSPAVRSSHRESIRDALNSASGQHRTRRAARRRPSDS